MPRKTVEKWTHAMDRVRGRKAEQKREVWVVPGPGEPVAPARTAGERGDADGSGVGGDPEEGMSVLARPTDK